eukprot:comp20451_c0_seq1/m.26019 comp20451_c0_seq1/g.26019  ORF comp20451_c0_seq1/g.26019 comp20451_c0_seq1/m.26019 type:complete len:262 (-) comp20451_c0_seq1:497-1282(-)
MAFTVRVIPLLEDNYGYLIIDPQAKVAGAVDPAEPEKVLAAAEAEVVEITCVLTTHNHWDHAGGNLQMRKKLHGITVYGGRGDHVEGVTRELGPGDCFKIGNVEVYAMYTPCHTPGHVCYVATQPQGPSAVFTGDTMFVAGCGNFNTGTSQQMYTALVETICTLPRDTKVYVGHEYTTKNLQFASVVEPENPDIQRKLAWSIECDKNKKPTVPSTIADELATNPFVRVDNETVQKFANVGTNVVEVIAAIRKLKTEWGRRS